MHHTVERPSYIPRDQKSLVKKCNWRKNCFFLFYYFKEGFRKSLLMDVLHFVHTRSHTNSAPQWNFTVAFEPFPHSDFFFELRRPQHLRTPNEQHFRVTHSTVMTTMARTPMTSRLWYWNQFRSCAATRRCVAPLCLMTNSVQKVASSSGSMGRSKWMEDRVAIRSL